MATVVRDRAGERARPFAASGGAASQREHGEPSGRHFSDPPTPLENSDHKTRNLPKAVPLAQGGNHFRETAAD